MFLSFYRVVIVELYCLGGFMKSNFSGALLWFGASIAITEIMTGALLAPLGLNRGVSAILLGHLIGCVLFYLIGLIGAYSKKGAMESTAITFGRQGSVFFSVLNIIQLVGWTAVMIITGALAMNNIVELNSMWIWACIIGLLIIVWVVAGLKNVSKINVVAVGLLLILSIFLAYVVFNKTDVVNITENISYSLALELSIAMPISWLPLIADYSKDAEEPQKFTLVSTISYFVGSCFMYIVGLGAGIHTGTGDIVQILADTGFGLIAMIIVVLSTVTTTYLDVYSAGESAVNIWSRLNPKTVSIVVCIIGTLIAIFVPILQYENFLYLIGSVFVPMASIMIGDYFINKNTSSNVNIDKSNIILWIIGFVIYRVFLNIDTILGSTIPVVIIILILCVVKNSILRGGKNNA